MKKTLFYYSKLKNAQERELYRQILLAVQSGKGAAEVREGSFTKERVLAILHAIDRDYPELYYVRLFGEGCTWYAYQTGGVVITFEYRYSEQERKRKVQETEAFLQYILSHVPEKVRPSGYLTALWLHDLIAQNVRYDHDAIDDADEHEEAYSIEGGIEGKKAVCSGVARLYMMLCERLDIWCTYLCGSTKKQAAQGASSDEGSGNRHAWNLLYLDGIYTQVDTTWDLCDDDSRYVTHTYFGMSDAVAALTREADTDTEYPICPEPNAASWYFRNRCCFKTREKMEAFLLEQTKKKKPHFEFRFDARGNPDIDSSTVAEWVSAFMQNRASRWEWVYREKLLAFSYDVKY